jgi:hypothetical protein
MSRPSHFHQRFKRIVENSLTSVRGLSLRHFCGVYDYDDFLDGEALQCTTSRQLAVAFASRFLDTVPPAYAQAISMALVVFLAEQSGHKQLDKTDQEAIKELVPLDPKDERQLGLWMDAYFRDVS